jgi:DNA-binding transcriptional ArsR family regulator
MDIYMALSVPIRRSILESLSEQGRQSASEISRQFDVTASAISQHLKILRESKLVTMERQAQQRIYQVNPVALKEVTEWSKTITDRYNRMDAVLEEMQRNKGDA